MHAQLVHMDSDTSVPIHMHGHTTNTRKTGKKKKGNMKFAESSPLGSERVGRLGGKGRGAETQSVSDQLKTLALPIGQLAARVNTRGCEERRRYYWGSEWKT